MARNPSPIPYALHPDVLVLDQPGRTILCLRHHRPAPTQRPPRRSGTLIRHSQMGHRLEREPEAIHLDQARRTDPRIPQTTSTANYRRRTLGPLKPGYSHSIVPGGLLVTSSTTRLTSATSLVMRLEMCANTS